MVKDLPAIAGDAPHCRGRKIPWRRAWLPAVWKDWLLAFPLLRVSLSLAKVQAEKHIFSQLQGGFPRRGDI